MAVNINVPSQVKTYANLAAFPASGALKTIYIAEDTNKTYRWTGSVYTEISATAASTWGAIGGTLSNQTDLQTALNAKQNSLGYTPVPETRTLTINGTTQDLSADRTFTISTGITIGTTLITSGTVGRVLFQGTGNVVQQSSSLFWDATNNRLGIGTSSPLSDIDISKSVGSNGSVFIRARNTNSGGEAAISVTNDLYYAAFELFGSTFGMGLSNTALFTTQSGITNLGFATLGAANISFRTNSTGSTNERLTIFGSSGNIGINTTTDAGFRLDVNGTARVQTSLEIAGATGVTLGGGASALSYSGNVLNIGNSASWTDIRLFAGGVQKFSQTSTLSTISNTTINLSTATVQLAGVNALTYSGTDIRIGSVAAGFNSLSMYVAGSERARIASTGNVLINTTTDAGFRLDVNGTARVSGNTTINGQLTTTTAFPTIRAYSANTTDSAGFQCATNNGSGNNASFITYAASVGFGLGGNAGFGSGTSIIVFGNSSANSGGTTAIRLRPGGFDTAADALIAYQNSVSIGTTNIPVASAVLDVVSTTQGFLPPRMTQTQRNAIASPAIGLEIYQTDATEGKYIYKSSGWTYIG